MSWMHIDFLRVAHPRTNPSDHCSEKSGNARPSFVESVTSPNAALITLAFPESKPFSPLAKTIPQKEFESPPKRRMEQATPRRPASSGSISSSELMLFLLLN